MNVRTRFAPSPTGSLHLGGARTALYNYLLAKSLGGAFILRIEDTDAERSTEQASKDLMQDLAWLGLRWDEGPAYPTVLDTETGSNAPYTQSKRSQIYQHYAHILLEQGRAFYCFASDAEIEEQRAKATHPMAFQFQSPYKDLPLKEAQLRLERGERAVVRFRNTLQERVFTHQDLVRGEVSLPGNMVGDFVILRQDASPVYNFCCALDDALMGITHVLRGEEHLSNTLRQSMIYEALGFTPPKFGHLSLILGPDQKKLSKRSGAKSIGQFKEEGFLAEAVLNYLALLGWSDPKHRDILSLSDLISAFSVDRLNAAAPMFDAAKCFWVNSQHLKALPDTTLWQHVSATLAQSYSTLPEDTNWQQRFVSMLKSDWNSLNDALESFRLFNPNTPPKLESEACDQLKDPNVSKVFLAWQTALTQLSQPSNEPLSQEHYQSIVASLKETLGCKGKALFMPLRIALLGRTQGTDLATCIALLPLASLRARVQFYAENALN